MSEKIKVQGTKFQVSDGGDPETFSDVPGVVSITGLGSGSAAEIDTTDLSSLAKEYVQGLKDEGSITIELIYDPSDPAHSRLEALRDTQQTTNFKVIASDAISTEFMFQGFVQSLPKDFSADDVLRSSATIRITGPITTV